MAYCGSLENCSRATDRGFESYLFRIFFLPKKSEEMSQLLGSCGGFEVSGMQVANRPEGESYPLFCQKNRKEATRLLVLRGGFEVSGM